MPTWRTVPVFELDDDEKLGSKSIFHWCPNSHLHSKRRLFRVYHVEYNVFGIGPILQEDNGWWCPACGYREEEPFTME